jgi:hypothetical protein
MYIHHMSLVPQVLRYRLSLVAYLFLFATPLLQSIACRCDVVLVHPTVPLALRYRRATIPLESIFI